MKKIILFDFFGVISSEVGPFWFRRYVSEEIADETKARIVSPGDKGEISEREMFQGMGAHVGVSAERARCEWLELARIDPDIIEYIRKLKKNHRVYLLSNATSGFLRDIIKRDGLEPLFDGIFISAEIKIAKPSEEYFRYCLGKIGAKAEECIFTDDNPKNVDAARAVGISAHRYEGLAGLRDFIERNI